MKGDTMINNRKLLEKYMLQFNADKDKISYQSDKLRDELSSLTMENEKLCADNIIAMKILSTMEWEYFKYIDHNYNKKQYGYCEITNSILLKAYDKNRFSYPYLNDWDELSSIFGVKDTPFNIELNKYTKLMVDMNKFVYLIINCNVVRDQIDKFGIKLDRIENSLDRNYSKIASREAQINKYKKNIEFIELLTKSKS